MNFRIQNFFYFQKYEYHRKIILGVTFMCVGFCLISFRAPINEEEKKEYFNNNVVISSKHLSLQRRLSLRNFKYILLWTKMDDIPFNFLDKGSHQFLLNNCSKTNCYITGNKHLLDHDLTQFHAIVFDGTNINSLKQSDLPKLRKPEQKYIFFNIKSSDSYPVCNQIFDDFFNWTCTYKLDSDIPYPYVMIKDQNGQIVGPKTDMKWPVDVYNNTEDLHDVPSHNKTAAWFVSNCETKSQREKIHLKLVSALNPYGLHVDVYGDCGPLKCLKDGQYDCDEKQMNEYFFSLNMEDSLAEDYVTENIIIPLTKNVVPIVFGGANYTRFLPPDSYLNAREQSPEEIAALMDRLIKSPELYRQYLKHTQPYIYYNPMKVENVCAICEALNNEEIMTKMSTYVEFRKWWNPNFIEDCKIKV